MRIINCLFFLILLISAGTAPIKGNYSVPSITGKPPVIDGKANEKIWEMAPWQPIDELWLGKEYDAKDFSGRYRLLWDTKYLYLLAEITDDTLVDTHPDPLIKYWDDDCLEVFIDEDRSKGEHKYNYNAFAYHLSLKNQAVDYGPDEKAHVYKHVVCKRITRGHLSTWEVRFELYADNYKDGAFNKPVALHPGKKIGFALAYCDNDHSPERENFIGSIPVAGRIKIRVSKMQAFLEKLN